MKRGRVVNVYGYGWLRGRALTGEWRGSETEAFLSAGRSGLDQNPPDSSFPCRSRANKKKQQISDRRRDAACCRAAVSRRVRCEPVPSASRLAGVRYSQIWPSGGACRGQPDRIADLHAGNHWSRLPSTPCTAAATTPLGLCSEWRRLAAPRQMD